MTTTITKVRLFLASPGDVQSERKQIDKIVTELNLGVAAQRNLIVELVKWETHAWPGFGRDAQAVINEQIGAYRYLRRCNVESTGTPTAEALSGTEEEFKRAYELWKVHKRPKLLFYFSRKRFDPSSEDELEQKRRVLAFKRTIQELGALYWEYSRIGDFRTEVTRHLTKELLEWEQPSSAVKTSTLKSEDFCNLQHWSELEKVGRWELKGETMPAITGEGMYTFLLSKNNYGDRTFRISAKLSFRNYIRHSKNAPDTANAGIVFGWNYTELGHTYHNILLTGTHLLRNKLVVRAGVTIATSATCAIQCRSNSRKVKSMTLWLRLAATSLTSS